MCFKSIKMKTVFKTIIGFFTALVIVILFIVASRLLSFDYYKIAFLSGWVSCIGYNVATKLYDDVHS